MEQINHGDYVTSSRHGHTGRAYKFEMLTNDDADWVAGLNIPLTIEDMQGRMVGILCDKGGAVSVPESSCKVIPAIDDFSHPYKDEHFPDPSTDKGTWHKFFIMKAHHLTTSGRKLGLKKICKDEPNCTIVVADREAGGRTIRCFIIGAAGDYGVKPGSEGEYTIDTGNGYKGGGYLHILDQLQVRNGKIISAKIGTTCWESAYTWVMK